jgi:TIR domain
VAGQRWKEALQEAAYRCEVVVALVSQEWLASSWCKSEIDAARQMGKKVIVALVGVDKARVPLDLADEQFIDLTGEPQAYRRLKEGLKRAGLDPTSFPFEAGRRPYPGFAYIEEQDAAVFFGRDAQIVRGLDEIRRLVHHRRRVGLGQVLPPARGPMASTQARRPGVAAAADLAARARGDLGKIWARPDAAASDE